MTDKHGNARVGLWTLLALGAVLRLVGIRYGLPAVFNSDEPHVVDIAVSFGAGTLNPHLFKYPTLWMYVLFASYGAYFAAWSGFGLVHSVRQFGELFARDPTGFFLIARVLAGLGSLLGCERVYRTGRLLWGPRAGLFAAGFLAVSPWLVEAGHASTMYSLMFFLASWSWWFAVRYLEDGAQRDLLLCGFLAGLSVSSQYTAAPLGILVPCVWLARRWGAAALLDKRGLALLAAACALVPAGFLLGSPFILIEFRAFWANILDNMKIEGVGGAAAGPWVVARNLVGFQGFWAPSGLAAAAGALLLCRRQPRRALTLLAVPLVYLLFLSRSSEGGWPRYLFAALPATALMIGAGAEAAAAAPAAAGWAIAAVVGAALLGPGAWRSAVLDRQLLLPDSRTFSARWIEAHVPEGTKILLDQEHASPRLAYSRECVDRLLRQTREAGHPRARYYDFMRTGLRPGGYDVYRVLRDYRDLRSWPGHVAFSAVGQPMLDAREGLRAVREAGIEVVVLTSYGATLPHSPDLAKFLMETQKEGRLLAEFLPRPGELSGPEIRIYSLTDKLRPR